MPQLPQAEYYASLPKKRVAAAVLFWNDKQELLLLHKTYDDNKWNLPGGVVELSESPRNGAIREVREETGLIKNNLSLVGLDYKPTKSEILSESLQFVFDGGILRDEDIKNIKLSSEHSEFKFIALEDAYKIFSHYLGLRVKAIMDSDVKPVYLEKGQVC